MSSPLISSAKNMLRVLNEHLDALDARHQALIDEFVELPSRNQHYFVLSDDNGRLELFQDAAFVVEQIFVVGQQLFDETFFQLSIQDNGSSRFITLSNRPAVLDTYTPAVVPAWPATRFDEIADSNFVPPEMLVPMYGVVNEFAIAPNVDCWLDLPVEWLLPRGDVVLIRLNPIPTTATVAGDVSGVPQVILSGYKVY